MKSKVILIFSLFYCACLCAQNKSFRLLEQRLEDLRTEASAIEKNRDEILHSVEILRGENKRLKRNAVYYRKQLYKNEIELEESVKKLFDIQNNLTLKIAEVSVLSQQVILLQSKNDSLKTQVGILSSIKDTLKNNLDSTRLKLALLQKEYDAVTQSAKIRSVEHSLSNPYGYHRKRISVFLVDGGFNLGQGISFRASMFSFLIPTRSILFGLNVGYDNFSRDHTDGYDDFSIIPISLSWRGTFNALSFFKDNNDTEALNFNFYYILEVGGGFVLHDTKQSKNITSSILGNIGVGAIRPIWDNVGLSFSASLASNRFLVTDTNKDKFGITRLGFSLKFGFIFKL